VIIEARRSVEVMRSASRDPAASRQASHDLNAAIARLPAIAGRVSTVVAGAAFVIPGLNPQSESARQLSESVENLRRSVSALDSRLTATAGSGSQQTPSPDELSQIEAELARLETATTLLKSIPPEVLSAPFELQLENIAPVVTNYISFYAPAVLVLLMQHLAVTLGALSMARIRLLGLMELLQTSPVRAREVVTGNYLSYGLLCAIAGGILLALLVFALDVPVFGDIWLVIGTLGLLVACSLGVGFVISMLSSSEQQAAQVAMLVLIASVFFSGFVVALNTLVWPVRALSYALPATYAIRTLQDVMLRGVMREHTDLAVLGGAAVAGFVITVGLFRREYRAR
jgi:ABC-2 type transport system permease protein